MSRAVRSRMMRSVRRTSTTPELAVATLLPRRGVKRNWSELPGSPDFVHLRERWAVFVHGCFWHGHAHCRKTKSGAGGRIPVQNRSFWTDKLAANRARDRAKAGKLRRAGFAVLTVWECELRNPEKLAARIARFLDANRE